MSPKVKCQFKHIQIFKRTYTFNKKKEKRKYVRIPIDNATFKLADPDRRGRPRTFCSLLCSCCSFHPLFSQFIYSFFDCFMKLSLEYLTFVSSSHYYYVHSIIYIQLTFVFIIVVDNCHTSLFLTCSKYLAINLIMIDIPKP